MVFIKSSSAILTISLICVAAVGQELKPLTSESAVVIFDKDGKNPTAIPANIAMEEFQKSYPKTAPPSFFNLTNDPSVVKELELVGDQLTQLRELHSDSFKQIQTQMQGLRDGSLTGEEYTNLLYLRKATEDQKLKNIMLPHQLARLGQIRLQTHIKAAGTANAVSHELVASELGLTSEQQVALKTRAEKIKMKLEKEFKRLKEEAKNELLEILTKEQRTKLLRMTGEEYAPKESDWVEASQKALRANALQRR